MVVVNYSIIDGFIKKKYYSCVKNLNLDLHLNIHFTVKKLMCACFGNTLPSHLLVYTKS